MTMRHLLIAQYEADADFYAGNASVATDPAMVAYWNGEAERARGLANWHRQQHG